MSKKDCNNACDAHKRTSIGGQALIEGIMMRGPKMTAMAVRDPKGDIILEKWATSVNKRPKFFKLPFIRGIFNFFDSMKVGYKCLMRSAELSGIDEIEDEMKKEKALKKSKKNSEDIPSAIESTDIPDADSCESENGETTDKAKEEVISNTESAEFAQDESKEDTQNCEVPCEKAENSEVKASKITVTEIKKDDKKEKSGWFMNAIMVVSMILGVVLSIGLFIMLPSFVFDWTSRLLPALKPDSPALASLIKSAFEGVLKILILVGYMAIVSHMKDIKRTFQYHGAEHKTIFCYEHNLDLTVANVRIQRRFHPRCGTSFLILMLLVGIFISFFIDPVSILISGTVPPTWLRAIIRLLLLPIVMGVGYELIKLAGRKENLFTKIISAPGLWLQRLTVFEPEDDMIECAIAAFKEVIPDDHSDEF